MEIRPFRLADINAIVKLYNKVNPTLAQWSSMSVENYVSYPQINTNENVFVALENKEIDAFVLACPMRNENVWELWEVVLSDTPPFPTEIITHTENIARAKNVTALRSDWIDEIDRFTHKMFLNLDFKIKQTLIWMEHSNPSEIPLVEKEKRTVPIMYEDEDALRFLCTHYNNSFAHNNCVDTHTLETMKYQFPRDEVRTDCSFFAYENDCLAGFIMAYFDMQRKKWVLDAIGVEEDFRGKGFGRELISTSIASAKRKPKLAGLYVDSANSNALELYKSLGFKPSKNFTVYEKKL